MPAGAVVDTDRHHEAVVCRMDLVGDDKDNLEGGTQQAVVDDA